MCKFIISAHPGRDLKQLEATLKAANLKVADEAYIVEHFAAEWVAYAQGENNLAKIVELYKEHKIDVISDLPGLLFLREIMEICPSLYKSQIATAI